MAWEDFDKWTKCIAVAFVFLILYKYFNGDIKDKPHKRQATEVESEAEAPPPEEEKSEGETFDGTPVTSIYDKIETLRSQPKAPKLLKRNGKLSWLSTNIEDNTNMYEMMAPDYGALGKSRSKYSVKAAGSRNALRFKIM